MLSNQSSFGAQRAPQGNNGGQGAIHRSHHDHQRPYAVPYAHYPPSATPQGLRSTMQPSHATYPSFSSSFPQQRPMANIATIPRPQHISITNSSESDWSKEDDASLLRCIRGYGLSQLDKAIAAFVKLSKGPLRSKQAIIDRYEMLQAEHKAKGKEQARRRMSNGSSQSTAAMRTMSSRSQSGTITPSSWASPSSSSAAARATCPPWTAEEDRVLLSSLRRHGRQWTLVVSDFTQAFPGTARTKSSLANRYRYLQLSSRAKGSEEASDSSSSTQDFGGPVARSSVSASHHSPALLPQDEEWTVEEENHLLQIALDHEHVTPLRDQVQAVGQAFRAVCPNKTMSLESLHTKSSALLERYHEQVDAGEDGEASVIEESFGGESSRVDFLAEEVGQGGPREAVFLNQQQHSMDSSVSRDEQELRMQDQSEEAELDHFGASSLLFNDTHTAASPLNQPSPLDDFDYDVKNLAYGFRFERLPLNTQLCIYSPTHYKLRRLTPANQVTGSPDSDGEDPFFVFNIMQNRSTVGAVLPLDTKVHPLIVDAEGRRIVRGGGGGRGPPAGAETHFECPDKFRVEFYAPLGGR